MNQTLVLALITAIISTSSPALTQEAQYYTNPQTITTQYNLSYRDCTEAFDCTLEEQLKIIMDINEEMGKTIQRINQGCINMDYTDCIGPQTADRRLWKNMLRQMEKMMMQIDPTFKKIITDKQKRKEQE